MQKRRNKKKKTKKIEECICASKLHTSHDRNPIKDSFALPEHLSSVSLDQLFSRRSLNPIRLSLLFSDCESICSHDLAVLSETRRSTFYRSYLWEPLFLFDEPGALHTWDALGDPSTRQGSVVSGWFLMQDRWSFVEDRRN